MKRILLVLAVLSTALFLAGYASAADVCTAIAGSPHTQTVEGGQFTLKYSCVLDNSDTGYATFSDSRMTNFKGAVTSVRGIQGANPNYPNALVVSLQTDDGIPLPGFPAASITGSAGAGAWILAPGSENPIDYMGELKVLFTTNTTTGAIIIIKIQGMLF